MGIRDIFKSVLGREATSFPEWPNRWRSRTASGVTADSLLITIFAILGMMAGDGSARKLNKTLIAFGRDVLKLGRTEELAALAAFHKGSHSESELARQGERFRSATPGQRDLHQILLETATHFSLLASPDGLGMPRRKLLAELTHSLDLPPEAVEETIKRRREVMRLTAEEEQGKEQTAEESQKRLRQKVRSATATDTDRSYTILSSSPNDTQEVIRTRYRALVYKYHPDRVRAAGGEERKIEEARLRFEAILRAYETIRLEKGW